MKNAYERLRNRAIEELMTLNGFDRETAERVNDALIADMDQRYIEGDSQSITAPTGLFTWKGEA